MNFKSIAELVEYVSEGPTNRFSRTKQDDDFFGGTWEDAVRKALHGTDVSALTAFYELLKEVKFELSNEVNQLPLRAESGDYLDIGAYLSGEPETFWRTESEPTGSKPAIDVVANVSLNSAVSPRTIAVRGACVAAVVALLTERGYPLNLQVAEYCVYDGERYATEVHIPTQPLDIDALLFATGDPLFLRRLMFAALERYTARNYCYGYGMTDDSYSDRRPQLYFCSSSNANWDDNNYETASTAAAHAADMFSRLEKNPTTLVVG